MRRAHAFPLPAVRPALAALVAVVLSVAASGLSAADPWDAALKGQSATPSPSADALTPAQASASALAGTPAAATPPVVEPPPPPAAAASTNAPLDLNKLELRRLPAGQTASAGTPAAKPPATPATLDATRVGLALAAVIGLILLMRWGGRKFLALPAAASGGLMQVVARTPLAPRQQLVLVRVGRRLMVIGDSGGRLSGLGQIDDPDEVAALLGQARTPGPAAVGSGATFGALFGRLGQNFGGRRGGRDDDTELDESAAAGQRSERELLFAGSDDADEEGSEAAVTHDRRPYGVSGTVEDARPAGRPREVGLDEAQAQEAVEAARHDIQALRARLREVTQRLTGPARPDGGGSGRPEGSGAN